jgi:transcriptional regulator of acetoin/glycerol metabolism
MFDRQTKIQSQSSESSQVSGGSKHSPKLTPASAAQLLAEQPYDEKEIMRAWELFVMKGRVDDRASIVRPAIRHSWERSATLGVDAHAAGSPKSTSEDGLQKLRRENRELLLSASAAFRHVTEAVVEGGTMAVMTDSQGTILEVGGSNRTIDLARGIRLEVGAAWGESIAGTNGIGTALMTGLPSYIHAAEHFCEGVKAWSCVGIPLRDPLDGSMLGLIDLSGPRDVFHHYNLALALLSARQIQQSLTERMDKERISLLEISLSRVPSFASSEGMVLLDRRGRVLYFNETARERWTALGIEPELKVGARLAGDTSETLLGFSLPKSLTDHSFEPLTARDDVRGAMVVLSSKSRNSPTLSKNESPILADAKAGIVGRSESLSAAVEQLVRAARSRTGILIEGETGVGKELFARLAHAVGAPTGKEPFVTLNCGAASRELLERELFGQAQSHMQGSTNPSRGSIFQNARGGTLLLDEIGDMPLDLQPYLLRVIEDSSALGLNDSSSSAANVRLVASTNRNLKSDVEQGRFRRDLYYRMGAVRISIPPLRDRREDIVPLLYYYSAKFASIHNCLTLQFEPAVLRYLQDYTWPGNVRELRNLIERLALLSDGEFVRVRDLPEEVTSGSLGFPSCALPSPGGSAPVPASSDCLEDAKRRLIDQAIAESKGNISIAAKRLGVARSTIYRRIRTSGPEDFR